MCERSSLRNGGAELALTDYRFSRCVPQAARLLNFFGQGRGRRAFGAGRVGYTKWRMRVLAAAFLAILTACPLWGQPLYSFEPIAFGPPAPQARTDGTAVYDPQGRRLYVFAGRAGTRRNDLWAYAFDQAAWVALQPQGAAPPARDGHTMVFDSARRRLIVFGGQASSFFNDVWAYEIEADRWTRLDASGPAPNIRYGHSAIADPRRDRMVISHGFTDEGRFDDTWAFDFAANAWTEISPARRPLRRCLHRAAYDPARDRMLLYGGCASGAGPCPLDDLWAFDLAANAWTQLASGPPGREFYGVGFDSEADRMVIFGGRASGALLGDVRTFDPAANAWQEPEFSGPGPSARSRVEGAFVDGMGVVFFGGSTAGGRSTNELWLFAAAGPEVSVEGVANAFNFAPGGVAPGEIVSLFVRGGGPRQGVSAQFGPDGRLPFELAGVTVAWNGMTSPLYFVSDEQINAQVPYETAAATELELTVTHRGRSSAAATVRTTPTKAGLFPVVLNQDGTVNSAANPAAPGTVVVLFLTGQGVTTPPSVTGALPMNGYPEPVAPVVVEVGGEALEILFKGQAPLTAGVMQINARLGSGAGALAVRVRVGDAVSQAGVVVWTAR